VLKIRQILNNEPYEDIHIRHSLSQYISEDIAMHAGIPAAISEYLRFKNDTLHFIVPGEAYLIHAGREVAERGDFDNAILIFQAILSEYPESWEAYDALGETYIQLGDTEQAIRSFKKSLELNPQNTNAKERLKELERK
jgi:tetratricopeptide (TPR) repeat protein